MVTEFEEVPMSIVGGLDIHRKQLTFDWVDEQNDRRGGAVHRGGPVAHRA
jgi:hypothetical protein